MIWTTNVSNLLKEYELKHPPVIIKVNKFNEESAKEFSFKMGLAHNTGQDVIPIVIDSYGGEVHSLMNMISCINSSELPIATVVQGKAMSCGAILFSFGEEGLRFMDKDATIMIHDVSSWSVGKVEEIKASSAETSRLNEKVYKMMARNCGKHDNYFLDIVHQKGHADWYLEADEAKKHNLANQIRVPKFDISIGVDIKLV